MTTMTRDAPPVRVAAGTSAGLLVALVSAASFGLSGTLAKGLLAQGWTPGAAVTIRVCVGALVLAGPTVWALRGRWHLVRRHAGLLIAYGLVVVAGCQLAYFYAVRTLPVSVALMIEYTAPVVVVLWLWLRHGQRPHRLTVIGAAVAAVGLMLVLDVFAGGGVSLVGVGWALVAMIGAATYFILSAGQNELPPLALAGGGMLVGAVALLLAGGLRLMPMSASTAPVDLGSVRVPWWMVVLALGVITCAAAYTTGIVAGRLLGSRLASFVALAEVVAALVFAWLLLDEVPAVLQFAGGATILAGVVLVKLGEPARSVEPLQNAGRSNSLVA